MTPTMILCRPELHRVEGEVRRAYHLNHAVRGLLRLGPHNEAPGHDSSKS